MIAPQEWSPPGPLGAHLDAGRCSFRVWAPDAQSVQVLLAEAGRTVPLAPEPRGYFAAVVDDVADGARYSFVLDDGRALPDPASRHQPDGVHEPSAVVGTSFDWRDDGFRAPDLGDLVIYELHVGTFTAEGTFDSMITELPRLRDLGINAIELLPVAQFPGGRNWGYDGVFPFAAQSTYGGPAALKRLVAAAHAAGIAVILDVVYNHLGPEGNYLSAYGPYFTDRYRTPWGDALNYDGAASDEVRAFFIQSALQWIDEFHIDGLRCDAIHAIVDTSAYPFLAELTDRVRAVTTAQGRPSLLIAESDLSDPRVIRPAADGGLGFDAQWLDDFHHALHTVLTGETRGYYADYGSLDHLRLAFENAYVYAGQFSEHRGRRHGAPATGARPEQFVVCTQNHDQIGNRLAGDRLTTTLSFEQLRLAAACTLLGPFVPMLYMGEEYGEQSPFPYFVSHTDPDLVEAVRRGRREEFSSFDWSAEPPDPQDEATFRSAVLDPGVAAGGRHAALLRLHRDLLRLRRDVPVLRQYDTLRTTIAAQGRVLEIGRATANNEVLLAMNFSDTAATVRPRGAWDVAFDSSAPQYDAGADTAPADDNRSMMDSIELPPFAAVLLRRTRESE